MTDFFPFHPTCFLYKITTGHTKCRFQIVDELTLNYKGHHISKLIRESKKKSNLTLSLDLTISNAFICFWVQV
jgi:hypothetical protein